MFYCSIMIKQSHTKWRESLFLTSPDEYSTIVSDIPFPTVTVCADLKNNLTEFNWPSLLRNMKKVPLSNLE